MLELAELERRYAYPAELDAPWVRTAFVSSIDGSATDRRGLSGTLGGEPDEQLFALMRSLSDVILVAAGTVRAEGYAPVKPEEVDGDLRRRLGLTPVPPIAIVSASLDIPDALVAPGQIVFTCGTSPAPRRRELEQVMDVVVAGEDRVDCEAAIAALDQRALRRVVCEGGPTLHSELIAQDLVDEICLTVGPVLAGGTGPRIAHGNGFTGRAMRLAEAVDDDGVLLTRWIRARGH